MRSCFCCGNMFGVRWFIYEWKNGRFGKEDGGLDGSWASRVWLKHFPLNGKLWFYIFKFQTNEIRYFCYGWQWLCLVIQCRSLVEDVCMIFEFQDPPFCGCLMSHSWEINKVHALQTSTCIQINHSIW
jgi:hypothetical protein